MTIIVNIKGGFILKELIKFYDLLGRCENATKTAMMRYSLRYRHDGTGCVEKTFDTGDPSRRNRHSCRRSPAAARPIASG
ncbi:hypothetical protein [Rhizobium phaseoli]|uniref:hypothetical protein n=1 Tax=Rhizobium phaseoli TaxID=396 RepID=UPI00168150B8|nr:hypothetical protein [Rhizobium phaseoli]